MTIEEGHRPHTKGGPLKLFPIEPRPIGFIVCKRLHGGSIRDCECKTSDGWLECPPEARGILAPAERAAERKEWTARLSPPVQLATVFTKPDGNFYVPSPSITDIDLEPKTPDQIRDAIAAERRQFSASFSQSSGKASGFTGSICQHCQSSRMIRNGTCETCLDCYQSGECG